MMRDPDAWPSVDLVLARDLSEAGLSSTLKSTSARGRFSRIRRGAYVETETLTKVSASQHYRLSVLAVLSTRTNAAASGLSAAVVHGLPMVGRWPGEVTVLASGESGRRRNGVIETPRRPEESVVELDGMRVTSLLDTLIEVCRTAPFLTALTMVDAAARLDRYGDAAPLISLEELRASAAQRSAFRGVRRVQRVLEFATTGADTPFETLSRVVIYELGFPRPILQYPLVLPRSGKTVFCDFGWPDYRIDGEADGWGKYENPEYGSHLSAADRVRIEKRRENQVRGLRWGVPRWEWDDAWHPARLRSILLEAGLPIVRRPCSLR